MILYAAPSSTFHAPLNGAPTGLVGTITVQIENPNGTTFTAPTTAGIVEVEPGIYVATLTSPPTAGDGYTVVWNNAGVRASDTLVVTYNLPTPIVPPTGPYLVTLDKFKLAIGDTGVANDAKHNDALSDATAAILDWTDRDFQAPLVTESRTYKYAGGGILEIDDTAAINSVTYAGSTLAADRYVPRREGPASVHVYSYLELPVFFQESGEMGFEQNLDVWLTRAQSITREVDVVVNAQWGWPIVPGDVQRAAIITAAGFETDEAGSAVGLAAKSVAEIAESYIQADASQRTVDDPIPKRAQALLAPYRKHVL